MVHRVPFRAAETAHTGELVAPLDGELRPLRWEWTDMARGERVYAGTGDELLELWLPGYLNKDHIGRLEARIEHAAAARATLAAAHVDAADARGQIITDEARGLLLGSSWNPPDLLEWSHAVPLVLIDVFYIPYTQRPAPRSSADGDVAEAANLVWLRPSSTAVYLRSLAAAGAVQLAERVG